MHPFLHWLKVWLTGTGIAGFLLCVGRWWMTKEPPTLEFTGQAYLLAATGCAFEMAIQQVIIGNMISTGTRWIGGMAGIPKPTICILIPSLFGMAVLSKGEVSLLFPVLFASCAMGIYALWGLFVLPGWVSRRYEAAKNRAVTSPVPAAPTVPTVTDTAATAVSVAPAVQTITQGNYSNSGNP